MHVAAIRVGLFSATGAISTWTIEGRRIFPAGHHHAVHEILAVPPPTFPPVTKSVDLPQPGQARPLRLRTALTMKT
jgi:hypothetical protein